MKKIIISLALFLFTASLVAQTERIQFTARKNPVNAKQLQVYAKNVNSSTITGILGSSNLTVCIAFPTIHTGACTISSPIDGQTFDGILFRTTDGADSIYAWNGLGSTAAIVFAAGSEVHIANINFTAIFPDNASMKLYNAVSGGTSGFEYNYIAPDGFEHCSYSNPFYSNIPNDPLLVNSNGPNNAFTQGNSWLAVSTAIPESPMLTVADHCDGTSTITAKDALNADIPAVELTWSNGASGNPISVNNTTPVSATRTINSTVSWPSNTVIPAPGTIPSAIIASNNGPVCAGGAASFELTGTDGAIVSYTINGTPGSVTISGSVATIGTPNVSATQTLNLLSVSKGNCSQNISGSSEITLAKIWSGGSGNWNEAANWCDNTIPVSTDQIVISSGTPQLNVDFSVAGTLTINGTGSLVVDPAKTLDITGTGMVNFGNRPVTFRSAAAGTASLGKVLGTLDGATNVSVERFIPDNGFRSWRLLSVPTYGNGQTIRQAWQEGNANPNPGNNNLPGFGTQITGTGSAQTAQTAGFDNTSASSSILTWNGAGWSGVTTTHTPIANNKTYFLYVRGERSKGVTGATTNSSATTLRTNGSVYTGNQATPTIQANSVALVGNPYPSAIDFTQLIRSSSVSNRFYTWDSKKKSGNSLGVYQVFDADLDFKCLISGGSYSTNEANTTIESGQGFFVSTDNSGPGSVTLTENSKVSGTNGNLGLRPASPGTLAKLYCRLYSVNIAAVADVNVVKFDNAYARGEDRHDALKMSNTGENFAIQEGNRSLVIEGRPLITGTDTLYFRMWNMQQQEYQLQFEPFQLGNNGLTAVLEDNYLHSATLVDLSANTHVNFTVDANAGSAATGRFRIVFRQAAPLPVTFTSISASRIEGTVQVDWNVTGEIAILSYEVERSLDGRNFTSVGKLNATGNGSATLQYSFTDITAPAGTIFYRVKSLGSAGETKYTGIVKVIAGNVPPSFTIYPNPAEGGIINVQFNKQPAGVYSITLLSNNGQLVLSRTVKHAGNYSIQVLDLPAGISNGAYQLVLLSHDKTKTLQPVLINTKY